MKYKHKGIEKVSCWLIFNREISFYSIVKKPPFGYDEPIGGFFMNALNFSENIAGLRREKKITQEQLADFVGVTKASVSKWETGD